MEYIITIIVSYLLGSINAAYIIGKIKHVDIREKGSGNAGASNVKINFGWGYGIITALFDIGKSLFSVILFSKLYPNMQLIPWLAGFCAIIGHIFPFYMGFKGGKGLASYVGMLLGINYKVAIIVMISIVLITLITNYIALGTISVSIFVPIYYFIKHLSYTALSLLIVLALIMIYKHKINLIRIYNHEEIGFRK